MVKNKEEVVENRQEEQKIEMPPLEETPTEEAPVENQAESDKEEPAKESHQEKNFRELREKADRIQQERDAALLRLQEIEKAKIAQQKPEEPDYNVGADDLVEGKHLSKYDKKMKKLEEQLAAYQRQTSEVAVEARIKNQYPDFDKVVNTETINSLREAYPEISATINSSGDLYNKAVSAYTMIKNLGVYKEDNYQHEKESIQKNNTKPRSTASVAPQQGDSPLSRANAFASGLTEDLKQQLRKEMEIARKRY